MKKYILTLFAIVALLVNLTGCGGSGSGNSATGSENGGMATVRVNLNQDGTSVKDVDSVALYTPAAALREGVNSYEDLSLGARASVAPANADGVYKPASVNSDGTHEFNVPTGDYTLLASKGNTRAVLTGIRAASGDEPLLVASLTPTGSVLGKVVDSASKVVAGAMVYLVDTSCVAFSGADGSFEMTGVPTNTAFKISAIYSADNKQLVAATEDVKVDSSLTATLKNNIVVKENTVKTMNITGSIVDTKGNGLATKAIMAMNGNSMSVGLSDDTGKFSISVAVAGTYKVAALNAATPAVQTVTVSSSDVAVGESFVVAVTGKLASIKGSITLDTTRDTASFSKMSFDSFIIRLVGSDYTTTTKVNFDYNNLSNRGVTFDFTGIPAGKYGILVDPSANGFFGSVGNITVAEGQALDISSSDSIVVKYIKPSFYATWNADALTIREYLPWMDTTKVASYFSNAVLRYCRKDINTNITLPTPGITGVDAQFDFSNDATVASNSFDCVFSMFNTWSDPNTGLSGTLITESDVLSHSSSDVLLKNCDIRFVQVDSYEPVRNSDGSFTQIKSGDFYAHYYNSLDDLINNNASVDSNEQISSVGDASNKVIIKEDDTTLTIQNFDGTNSNSIPLPDGTDDIGSVHILAGKYVTVVYSLGGDICAEIYSIGSNNFPTKKKTITLAEKTSLNYIDINSMGQIAVDNAGNAYTVFITVDTTAATPKLNYSIYKLSNTESEITPVISGPLGNCETEYYSGDAYYWIPDIERFYCLNDGRFYIETDIDAYPSMITSASGIVEASVNSARKCCLIDKNGYMYRLQGDMSSSGNQWHLIRVTSLDGEVLEKCDRITMSGLAFITEDSNGNQVCCYTSGN